jgi:signal transduction histidine kinase
MIEVIVKDSGVGIKEENLTKFFKLFGLLDQTKELNTNGIGLGLHICKKIIEQFGGGITCKSEWGKGTSFIFLIALDEYVDSQQQYFRCRNPLKKVY